jgi:hypothetical protein
LFELRLEDGFFQISSGLMDLDFNASGELHLVYTVKILVAVASRLSARCRGQYHLERVPGSTENLKVLFEISVFVQHAHDQNTFLFR